jgi:hypothetical protein
MRMCDVDSTLAGDTANRPDGPERLVREGNDGVERIEIVSAQRRLETIGERQNVTELGRRRHMCAHGRNNAASERFGDVQHRLRRYVSHPGPPPIDYRRLRPDLPSL